MKNGILLLATIACSFGVAPEAQAQSFLKRLGQGATQAARAKAPKLDAAIDSFSQDPGAALGALQGLARSGRSHPQVAESGPAPAAATTRAAAAAPTAARRNAPRFPHDIPVPAEIQPAKAAFLEFSRYSCSDCEGGRGFDAWAGQALGLLGVGEFAAKVADLPVGGSLSWRGHASDGLIRMVAEAEVEGFPCRKVEWRLTRRADSQVATRPGLFCFGLPEEYVTQKRWIEVY